jgi:predicted Zn-dependent protease
MVVQTAAWIGINTGNASVKRFENIIMTDPGYYFIGHPRPMHISIVLERNNLEKEALIYYKLAYETYPNDPRCGFNYIMELCKTKQAVRADTVLGNLLNKNPEYTAQRMRAMFTLAQKEKQELFTTLALQHFYWGYCKNPDIVEKYFTREEIINNFKSLVELLTRTSDFVSAEPVLNTIMKLEPGNGFNHFMYAKIFFGQHKYDHAIEICNSLIASIPNIPFPYKLKAESYEKLHNKSLAIETLRNGITAVKDNSQKKDLQSSLDSLLHG